MNRFTMNHKGENFKRKKNWTKELIVGSRDALSSQK